MVHVSSIQFYLYSINSQQQSQKGALYCDANSLKLCGENRCDQPSGDSGTEERTFKEEETSGRISEVSAASCVSVCKCESELSILRLIAVGSESVCVFVCVLLRPASHPAAHTAGWECLSRPLQPPSPRTPQNVRRCYRRSVGQYSWTPESACPKKEAVTHVTWPTTCHWYKSFLWWNLPPVFS